MVSTQKYVELLASSDTNELFTVMVKKTLLAPLPNEPIRTRRRHNHLHVKHSILVQIVLRPKCFFTVNAESVKHLEEKLFYCQMILTNIIHINTNTDLCS